MSEPDWIAALRARAAATSRKKVGKEIGYSGATVSLVLSGDYKGRLDRVEARVRTALMNDTVACPELGEITGLACIEYQREAETFPTSNSAKVRMYRACRSCPRCPLSQAEVSDVA